MSDSEKLRNIAESIPDFFTALRAVRGDVPTKCYYDCACGSLDHTMFVAADPEWDQVLVGVQLAPLHPWYKRLWVAVKYVFSPHGDYTHWSETVLHPEDAQRLRDQLDQYQKMRFNSKEDARIRESLKDYEF